MHQALLLHPFSHPVGRISLPTTAVAANSRKALANFTEISFDSVCSQPTATSCFSDAVLWEPARNSQASILERGEQVSIHGVTLIQWETKHGNLTPSPSSTWVGSALPTMPFQRASQNPPAGSSIPCLLLWPDHNISLHLPFSFLDSFL